MSELHERFTINESKILPTVQIYLDGKEVSLFDLVKIANTLANELLNAGKVFKVENKEGK